MRNNGTAGCAATLDIDQSTWDMTSILFLVQAICFLGLLRLDWMKWDEPNHVTEHMNQLSLPWQVFAWDQGSGSDIVK